MEATRIFRHENKYFINNTDAMILSARLPLLMQRDENADENGNYFIRSLYFDDVYNASLQEKEDGTDPRIKIRIRAYNLDERVIKLECKQKQNQYIYKQSLNITRKQCDALIAGDSDWLLHIDNNFARQMYMLFRFKQMRPRVIVDYVREAYVFPVEEVRVTIDKELHTGLYQTGLFDAETPTVPAMEPSQSVLEVKFNKYLVPGIRSLIQIGRVQRSAVSKYCLCRQYEQ